MAATASSLYLPREAAGGGPEAERSEEPRVEGASLKLGGSNGQPLAQQMGLAPSTTGSAAGGPPPAIAVAMGEVRGKPPSPALAPSRRKGD